MIIQNGTIELKYKQAKPASTVLTRGDSTVLPDIDPTTGFPNAKTATWGAAIPCQYVAVSYNNLGRVQGEHFVQAHYTIFVEALTEIDSEQLRLKDKAGNVLGEFSIMQVEPLDAVCERRIMV